MCALVQCNGQKLLREAGQLQVMLSEGDTWVWASVQCCALRECYGATGEDRQEQLMLCELG